MNAIYTENLTKFYGKSRGICQVSLKVEEGDFFGFIGPNGAGKSTTIRTLLGLISKDDGKAEIFGKDIEKHGTELLSDIGYMPSEANFYSGMRVHDILEFSARMRGKSCKEEAKNLCERLCLDTSKKVDELSLGNRKKVSIVCALQHRPRLYILDEPTSGLDPLMQMEFYKLLRERNEDGATVFLSSHVLSEVGKYCRNAAIIREGKILACDSVEKLGHTGVKRVTLRGNVTVPNIPGIKDVKPENDNVSFLYGGAPDKLLKELCNISIEDFTVTDPDLEEIFMHYYEKEGK